MLGPGDLIRLPADVVSGVRRLVDEVVRVRTILEDTVGWLRADVEYLKGEISYMRGRLDSMDSWLQEDVNGLQDEFAHVRMRVDEIADMLPTATRGPLEKVKDALTPESEG